MLKQHCPRLRNCRQPPRQVPEAENHRTVFSKVLWLQRVRRCLRRLLLCLSAAWPKERACRHPNSICPVFQSAPIMPPVNFFSPDWEDALQEISPAADAVAKAVCFRNARRVRPRLKKSADIPRPLFLKISDKDLIVQPVHLGIDLVPYRAENLSWPLQTPG